MPIVTSSVPFVSAAFVAPFEGLGASSAATVGHGLFDPAAGQRQLLPADGERDHDLDDRVPAVGHPLAGRLHQGPHLHGVEPRLDHPEPHATGAQHRVGLFPRQGGGIEPLLLGGEPDGGFLDRHLLGAGQELVQGRVEKADGDREAVHGLENVDEVLALDLAQLLQGGGLVLGRVGQDHPPDHRQAILAQEHVLGPAQADALGPEGARVGGVLAGVGVGPHGQVPRPDVVGPRQHGGEGRRRRRRGQGDLTGHHDAGPAVERDPVAFVEGDPAHGHRVGGQTEDLGPDHSRLTPAPGHDGGVADQTAPGGQDAFGGQHPVHVLGRGLAAHQNDLFAPLRRRRRHHRP